MPSIEELFAANIAATEKLVSAVEANTAARLGEATAPAATPAPVKPAKEKAVKPAPVETPAPEPEAPAAEEPAPEVESHVGETPESTFPKDKEEGLVVLTEFVKGAFAKAGPNLQKQKDAYMAIRKEWGVEKASELPEEKLEEFYNNVVKIIG